MESVAHDEVNHFGQIDPVAAVKSEGGDLCIARRLYAHLFSGEVAAVTTADVVADEKARIEALEHQIKVLTLENERLRFGVAEFLSSSRESGLVGLRRLQSLGIVSSRYRHRAASFLSFLSLNFGLRRLLSILVSSIPSMSLLVVQLVLFFVADGTSHRAFESPRYP